MGSTDLRDQCESIRAAIDVERLVDTAVSLIEIPSPTRDATAVADRLASMLREDRFEVERPEANWPKSPAVVGRFKTGTGGKTIQFHGHLDTVHLPFIAPRVNDGILYGSGASDMKGGIAAMYEALRALRDSNVLSPGQILLTAVELHEAPWGDARQLFGLIDEGLVGDAVLIPEYLADCLPIMGRGMAIFNVRIRRTGDPVHEVIGGLEQPRVIAAGAELVRCLEELDQQLQDVKHPLGDRESVFIGQINAGEIYNQSPTELTLSGTRRWLPGNDVTMVEEQYRDILAEVASRDGIEVEGTFVMPADGFELDQNNPVVRAFQAAYEIVCGHPLSCGGKPFLDDGNAFNQAGISAITHGPAALGAHTLEEEVPVSELSRVALVYALAAISFCNEKDA